MPANMHVLDNTEDMISRLNFNEETMQESEFPPDETGMMLFSREQSATDLARPPLRGTFNEQLPNNYANGGSKEHVSLAE